MNIRDSHNLKAFLLYLLCTLLLYAPVVFTGKSLLPLLYQPNGMVEDGAYGYDYRKPVNTFNVDLATPAYYELPVNKLVGDIYRSGSLPLWNPYQAGGTPLAAQYSTRVFFPYQIVENISPVALWDFFILGRLLLTGFFTFLFLRRIGLDFNASFIGGIFYMFSGTFVWFINLEQFTNTAMVLPIVMLGVEYIARSGWRPGYVAFCSVAFSLLLLAGQPEITLYAGTISFFYFLFRTIHIHGLRGILSPSLAFIISSVLGIAISAPLLIPFAELVYHSHHIHPPGGPMGVQYLLNWRTIFAILTPSATEIPSNPEMVKGLCELVEYRGMYYRFLPINGVWDLLGGYTGALCMLLIFTGLFSVLRRRNHRWRAIFLFFVSSGVVIILKNLGIRPFIWIGSIPLFDQVWSLRWAGPIWTFSFSVAGAIGLQTLTTKGDDKAASSFTDYFGGYFDARPYMVGTMAFLFLCGFYTLFSFIPVLVLTSGRYRHFSQNVVDYVVPSILSGSVVTLLVMILGFVMILYCMKYRRGEWGMVVLAVVELWWNIPRGYDYVWLYLKWFPFSIGLITVFLFLRERWGMGFWGVLFFLVAFLFLDVRSPNGMPERYNPFEPAPYLGFLKTRASGYRVMATDGVLFPNLSGSMGIMDVRYVNALTISTYHEFRRSRLQSLAQEEEPTASLWFTGRPERCFVSIDRARGRIEYTTIRTEVDREIMQNLRAYSLLGVRYVVVPVSSEPVWANIGGSSFKLVYDGEVKIYENTSALERAFVVYGIRLAGSPLEAQRIFFTEISDPEREAVIEMDRYQTDLPFKTGEGQYTLDIEDSGPNRVIVRVETSKDGLLVLGDVFYPGWRVFVNGKERRIFRVNGIVRGVFVREGKNEVVFTYSPLSFYLGLLVSVFALLICTSLALFRKVS